MHSRQLNDLLLTSFSTPAHLLEHCMQCHKIAWAACMLIQTKHKMDYSPKTIATLLIHDHEARYRVRLSNNFNDAALIGCSYTVKTKVCITYFFGMKSLLTLSILFLMCYTYHQHKRYAIHTNIVWNARFKYISNYYINT